MAAELNPGSLYLGSPVSSLHQSGLTCTLRTKNDKLVRSSKVILAIPANVYKNISFTPLLPPAK